MPAPVIPSVCPSAPNAGGVTPHQPTVFVVDDDEAMRNSLQWLIESLDLTVQTFKSGREFLHRYDPARPGCLVLDVRMRGMSGLELQDRLRKSDIHIPIIILTGHGDVPMAVRAIKAGAVEFLQKPVSDQLLLDHIQRALERDARDRAVRRERLEIQQRMELLTPREREVMDQLLFGQSNKQIADQLDISFKTVESHRDKVMKKMEARSLAHLMLMCLGHGAPPGRDPST
jgi:two-component system, LuxR family, response regulator FixJ